MVKVKSISADRVVSKQRLPHGHEIVAPGRVTLVGKRGGDPAARNEQTTQVGMVGQTLVDVSARYRGGLVGCLRSK